MKKKTILIFLLLTLSLLGLGISSHRFVRLTVLNKSSRKIEISLTGKNLDNFYYLRIPEGDRQVPAEEAFTIIPDTYKASLYYVELWDPVYGNQCGTKGETLDVTRNVTLIVLPCEKNPVNAGEPPSIVKFGGPRSKRGR